MRTRPHQLQLTLSDDEQATIYEAADARGMPATAFLRAAGLDAARRPVAEPIAADVRARPVLGANDARLLSRLGLPASLEGVRTALDDARLKPTQRARFRALLGEP